MTDMLTEILVVDYEPAFRIHVYKKLKALGYRTYLAQNGQEALVALWEKPAIGLVILDLSLPSINSLNIFEIIRRDFPDKKMIVCSALKKDEQKVYLKKGDDYYCKDEGLNALVEKVSVILDDKSRAQELRQDEKRSCRRVAVNVFASCEAVDAARLPFSSHFFSYTTDLSRTGGRFVVPDSIKTGQRFSVSLELPTHFLPLSIDCEVVWVRKSQKADRNNEAGVRFVKLDSPQDEEKLKNYLSFA